MADKNMPENNKSDILVILENIDQMLQCFTKMVNGYARNIQGVAIAVEAQALAQKLRLAVCRWEHKLPFKEACDVNFKEWEKKMNQWHNTFYGHYGLKDYDEITDLKLDANFFIDQYYYRNNREIWGLNDWPRYYEFDADYYYAERNGLSDEIEIDYNNIKQEIEHDTIKELVSLYRSEYDLECDVPEFQMVLSQKRIKETDALSDWLQMSYDSFDVLLCIERALSQLRGILHYSDNVLLNSNDSAFKDLYERLSVAHFDDLIKDAKGDFQKWLNSTPKKKRLDMMKKKLEKEKTKFFSGKWKEGLENYFDIDNIERVLEGIDAGKFIFRYRNDLTLEEVGKIIAQYHKIASFHNAIHDMENKENDVTPVIPENQAQEEKSMNLPIIFNPIIREDAKATNMIVEALRELALTTGNKSKKISGGKTWGHVKTSLDILGYIEKNCLGSDFGRAIEDICPGTICKNVEQALKRYNINMHDKNRDKTHDENIISDIGKVFDKLKCYLVTHYPQKFSKG